MANNHTKEFVQVRGHAVQCIPGYFTSNGTTTVLTTVKGVGFSVTRTNTGIFTITLSSTYAGFVSLAVNTNMSNTIQASCQMLSSTVSATNTITLTNVSNTATASTAVATELVTGIGVAFQLYMYNSSVTT